MDISLPVMGGPTATRQIRTLPGAASRVPIIAHTANSVAVDRETYITAVSADLDELLAAFDAPPTKREAA